MRYRKSIYRRNRIKSVIVIAAICIALTLVLFLILGNLLKDRSDNIAQKEEIMTGEDTPIHKAVRSVNAIPVALSDSTSKLSTRVLSAKNSGYSDICFMLDDKGGTLLYSSALAQELGKQAVGVDLWTMSGASKIFRDNGMYAIGVTHIKDFSNENDLARTAAIGYHSALIAEALLSEIDDVIIFTGELTADRYSELITLANEVHRLCPDGVLGLSLPPILYSSEFDPLLAELWNAFDYLAIDLTVLPEGQTDITSYVDSSLGGMLYYLLRYDVRVLIPSTADSNISASLIALIKAKGTSNIQIMPQ